MATYQNGGWYPVGPGGKARQYWNGSWYDTPQQNAGGNSAGPSIEQQNNDAVNKYIDDLMGAAQGQRDLMIKKLDAEHKLALGNDDAATAQFLETVADSLEQKIGRIPYDYQKYTNRELEDYARNSGRVRSAKQVALDRINEDEQVLLKKNATDRGIAGQNEQESLNERGLLTSPDAGQMSGLAGAQFKQNVTDPFNTAEADITRGAQRSRFDTETTANQQLEDLGVNNTRTLEDLKTDTRRGVIDQQNATQFGKEEANNTFEEQRKALERARDTMLRQSKINSATVTGIKKGVLGY